jgi:GH25 family lysozyme M1 (1,4-beta-N-acetylmuramidase)
VAVVLGIDVAGDVQGPIPAVQWQAVALDKRFVYCQARLGNDGDTPLFDQYVAGARAAGIVVGAYLFCYCLPDDGIHAGRDPEDQVQAFFAAADGLGGDAGDLPPALDLESPPPERWGQDGVSPAMLEDWTGRAVAKTKALFGVLPVVYTYRWWAQQAQLTAVGACPLWLAAYAGATYTTAPPWSYSSARARATILQTGNGTGPTAYRLPNGSPVDEDQIDGVDFAALLRR